jgi:hypothetical protein
LTYVQLGDEGRKSIVSRTSGKTNWESNPAKCRFILYLIHQLVVFSLAFAIRDSIKLSACFGMLEHSFLGCKSGFRASDCIQRTGSSAGKGRYIYRDGGWESFESYESYKITLEKVMNEGEGRRMLEVLL